MMRSPALPSRLQQVDARLRGLGRVVVAFSGGIDSTLLLALARRALGKANAPAATADSPSLAREDLEEAKRLAAFLDAEHVIVPTAEVSLPEYRRNTPGRCYLCKGVLFEELDRLARSRGIATVVYGAIGDDVAAERPGQRAAAERSVLAPLQEAGLAKWDVREAARALGLPNWDRPQNACLSSRIPHGMVVTEAKLRQVEQAEALLHGEGFHQVRVRHLGERARIEVGPDEVRRFEDAALRERVTQALSALGFASAGLDPRGYQPGGADRPIEDVTLNRERG
jgi:uncharacterized protein